MNTFQYKNKCSSFSLRFNRDALQVEPIAARSNDLKLCAIRNLESPKIKSVNRAIKKIAQRIIFAKTNHSAVILMMGAHVIRSGVQRYIIDLMEKGYISCVAINGGGMIHDFEFSLIGATTESVSRYIKKGQFGLWKETSRLNDIINYSYKKDRYIGMGEALGRYIENKNLPYKSISILANAYRLKIPVTVHVGIGYDIIHEHANCDGAATGALSYNDFLKFASIVQRLEGGVVMNFGSAVMAPEIFLKALSMARNVARQQGKNIRHFSTLVCDLVKLPFSPKKEPTRHKAVYYFRPFKTMLIRTVADGGESFYVKGRHTETVSALWLSVKRQEK